jgi:hypothetical protein
VAAGTAATESKTTRGATEPGRARATKASVAAGTAVTESTATGLAAAGVPVAAEPAVEAPSRAAQVGAVLGLVGQRRPRTRFVLVVLGVLGTGLIGLLLLNSALAANSFAQKRLEKANSDLSLREQELGRQVAAAEAPGALEAAAKKLGLVPSGQRGFLIIGADGRARVAGTAVPATEPPPPPPPPKPTPSGPPADQHPAGTAGHPAGTTTTGGQAAGHGTGTGGQGTGTAGTNTAGTNTAGTNTAGTNTAGTNTAGTNTAGTNTAGTNGAGTQTTPPPSHPGPRR